MLRPEPPAPPAARPTTPRWAADALSRACRRCCDRNRLPHSQPARPTSRHVDARRSAAAPSRNACTRRRASAILAIMTVRSDRRLARSRAARRPHQRARHRPAPRPRRRPRLPRRARPGGLPAVCRRPARGRPARPGQSPDLRHRAAHRHRCAGRRSLQRQRPLAAHRYGLRRQFGRRLRRRVQASRLRLPAVDGALTAPGYVVIGRQGVSVREAGDLWGADVPTALRLLRERHPGSEAAVIGPAGENGVLFASIVNNRGRSIGRGGLGAVMGAKRLKAIVVEGDGELRPSPADDERFRFVVYEATKMLKSNPITSQALPEFGTAVLVNVLNQAGALPTRNFRESQFEHAEDISGEALRKGFTRKRSACRGCSIGCARRTADRDAERRGPRVRDDLGAGRRLRRGRPLRHPRSQLRLQPSGSRHHHHGLDHRLRHGAHRRGSDRRRPALRRRRRAGSPDRRDRRPRGPRRRACPGRRGGWPRATARPGSPCRSRASSCPPTTRAA